MPVFYRTRWAVIMVLTLLIAASPAVGQAENVKLDSSTFGAIKARPIGPAATGGRITAIVGNPDNPRVIYVGTAGGGVWKTVDGGITFTPIFDKYTMSIGTIALDPSNPDHIWVGTGEINVRNTVSVGDGLYFSPDGGKTWKHMGFEDSERIAEIRVNPKNPDIVYVCVLGHLWNDHPTRGVYKTTDGGKTWKRVLYVDEKTGCGDLDIDPKEPDIIYAAMWQVRRWPWFFKSGGPGSGFYKSEDGGKTWKKLTEGLPKGELGRIDFAVAPSHPATLYAIVEAKETALYRSDDTGLHWRKINDSLGVRIRPFYLAKIEVDPKDHNRVYNPSLFLQVSEDGGRSFSTPEVGGSFEFGGGVHGDNQALWINPKNPDHLILGTDGGVYVSYNRGGHWKFLHNLPVAQFYHVSVDDAEPYHVCGGLQDNGSWCGVSRTFSSLGIRNKDWFNVGGGDGFYTVVDPTNPNIIYHSWQGGHLQYRNRITGEIRDIMPRPAPGEPEYRFNWNAAFAMSPNHPGRIYYGAQFLFRSDDRGQRWVKISPDLTTNDPAKQRQEESGGLSIDNTTAENHCTIYSIAESPKDDQILWVCTDDGNLQVTTDGGKTWKNVVANIPGLPKNTWCSGVEPSHHKRERAYVVFDGHRTGDMNTYVFRTDDLGQTWTSLVTNDLEGYAWVIREDLQKPNLLFLGTEFGLFISLDGGKSWAPYREHFPRVAVRDMVIHPRTHDLVIATHGRGIYIIDDITPLRALTPEVLNADAAVLPARPSIMRDVGFVQEFPGHDGYFGPNPREGAVITYYLKRRHIFGDLKIEILDAKGKVIKTLPTTKRRGINRVYWDMRLPPPKVAAARGLSGAFFSVGPRVPDGEYRVRLIKGKAQYEGTIRLIPDPQAGHSPEDRKLRHEAIMRLYHMQEDLAYIADTLKSLREQAEDRAKKLEKAGKKKGLRRELRKFARRLKDFRSELVQEAGFVAGDRLREKVLELYGAIMQYGGRPTEAQMRNIDYFADQMKGVERRFKRVMERDVRRMQNRLRSNGLKPFHILTREEFNKAQEKGR